MKLSKVKFLIKLLNRSRVEEFLKNKVKDNFLIAEWNRLLSMIDSDTPTEFNKENIESFKEYLLKGLRLGFGKDIDICLSEKDDSITILNIYDIQKTDLSMNAIYALRTSDYIYSDIMLGRETLPV
jgi:hypothetical protein